MDFFKEFILPIIVLIVFIWIVLGPKRKKETKISKKDVERLIVEQITRRK